MTDFTRLSPAPEPFLDLSGRWTPTIQSPGVPGVSAHDPQDSQFDPVPRLGVAAANDNISSISNAYPSQLASSSNLELNQATYALNVQQDLPNEPSYEHVLLSDSAGNDPLHSLEYDHALSSMTKLDEYAYNEPTSLIASLSQRQLDYSPNVQPDLPTGLSYDSALRLNYPHSGNGLLVRSSIDRSSNSPDQLVDAATSPSASRQTPNAEPGPAKMTEPASGPASSTSRSPADRSKALEEENKMRKETMMGVFALNSRKRKRGELPTCLPDAPGPSDGPAKGLQPKPKRKKKEYLSTPNAAMTDATGGGDMMNGREHAEKASLRDHCRQASMQIDHSNARNAWLENELHPFQTESDNQVRAAAANYQQQNQEDRQKILAMTSEQVDLRNQINNLEWAGMHQRYLLATKEQTIAELQMKLRACQWRLTQTQGQIQT